MRADRLVSLLLLLQARGHVTAAEAAAELEVSVPTVRRDLEALSSAGVPVYAQAGRGGGWSLVGGARTDLTGLTAPEVHALFLLAGPGQDVSPAIRSALRKLVRALPSTFRAEAEAAGSATVLDHRRWGRAAPVRPPHLDALQAAVVARRRVRITYASRDGRAGDRDVEPLGLVDHDGVWYLLAQTARGRRTFRVDRVREVETEAERFERPDGFDLATAWEEVSAVVERARSAVETTVTLPDDLVAPFTDVLGARYVDVVDQADGRTRLHVRADTPRMLARQLAGWADVVAVEGPDAVRDELARLGGALSAAYGS
ncbi:helix-turn-helix transcriptional regulator [Microlunatus flavus]|uniref:Predicted DNA-binding transcriptional regulator YafY, contains an HTH and WYL domains n=1 Tax=Microlunatus flavus TaxID=1036181 RepID=A0A1H9CSR2_9ACTN|nr:WYL domain-containing protein [Microlunatus flavus]SEQ04205.1 Predicted DNA-binding transcriptional regulator YafY, contains an HTH and WYL domains [Microlunatus flavus]